MPPVEPTERTQRASDYESVAATQERVARVAVCARLELHGATPVDSSQAACHRSSARCSPTCTLSASSRRPSAAASSPQSVMTAASPKMSLGTTYDAFASERRSRPKGASTTGSEITSSTPCSSQALLTSAFRHSSQMRYEFDVGEAQREQVTMPRCRRSGRRRRTASCRRCSCGRRPRTRCRGSAWRA